MNEFNWFGLPKLRKKENSLRKLEQLTMEIHDFFLNCMNLLVKALDNLRPKKRIIKCEKMNSNPSLVVFGVFKGEVR